LAHWPVLYKPVQSIDTFLTEIRYYSLEKTVKNIELGNGGNLKAIKKAVIRPPLVFKFTKLLG
jgi:hypothetical protein